MMWVGFVCFRLDRTNELASAVSRAGGLGARNIKVIRNTGYGLLACALV
jgi:hypothetical protein